MHTVHVDDTQVSDPGLWKAPSKEVEAEYAAKCQSCGACCSYYAYLSRCIQADGPLEANGKPLTLHHIRRTKYVYPDGSSQVVREEGDWMRRKNLKNGKWPACVAFEGVPGESARCGIYDQRPSACRNFAPGSPNCIKVRKWAGFETE